MHRLVHLWQRLRWTARAAVTAWRTPFVVVDVDEHAALVARAAQVSDLEAETRRLRRRKAALALLEARAGDVAAAAMDVAETLTDPPCTADGDLHVAGTAALIEVGVWGARLDALDNRPGGR